MSENQSALKYISVSELTEALFKGGVQIIDVRDEDFDVGGHIEGARHCPSESFHRTVGYLAREFADLDDILVFHCRFSQERGPRCAAIYLNYVQEHFPHQTCKVQVLEGGFAAWQAHLNCHDGKLPANISVSLDAVTPCALIVSRARGCMLGLMVGDALGAAVEGFPRDEIRELAQQRWGVNTIEDFICAVPMGTFVSGTEPATYRPAKKVNDVAFVPTGPPTNPSVERQCARKGMYTDDTNSSLAIAFSIVTCGKIDATHCAHSCAEFWRDNEHYRGCPPTAKKTMLDILAGVPASDTGLPPRFPFPGGSFANGGAMRISPVGIACHAAAWSSKELRAAVEAAVLASHRHPEAIDFAVVQARAVQYAMHMSVDDFDVQFLLQDLAQKCYTTDMADVIRSIAGALQSFSPDADEQVVVSEVVSRFKRPGSGMGFQIASVHMAPCVLWSACLHFREPAKALKSAIDLAGDTDTTASMVGAIMGALHGEAWCANWAASLENGSWGRGFALDLAERLCNLNLRPESDAGQQVDGLAARENKFDAVVEKEKEKLQEIPCVSALKIKEVEQRFNEQAGSCSYLPLTTAYKIMFTSAEKSVYSWSDFVGDLDSFHGKKCAQETITWPEIKAFLKEMG